MNLTKKISFLLLVCLTAGFSFAQQPKKESPVDQYRAIQWTIKDGLSADGVHTLIKDAKGFMWVGSHLGGFCRFDGAKFKKYLPEQNNRNTINSDKIISFTEDSLNNIWIVTDKGLSRYDFKADTFTNFSPLNNSAVAITLNRSAAAIVPIGSSEDTIFCMEPGALITAFDIHTLERRELIKLSTEIDTKVEWNTNKSFFDARSNSIWKLDRYRDKTPTLEQIFLNGKIKLHPSPCFRNVRHWDGAEDMKYDSKRNSIWINSGDGLLEFSLNDQKFSVPEALNNLIKLKEYDRDVGIDIDMNGRVWFATKSHGILIYDPKTETVQSLFSNNDPQKKAGDANLHIYCDRDGIVWTANYMSFGIYEVLPFNPSFKRYPAKPGMQDSLSNGFVITILPAARNKMWIGTLDGINIFDPITEKFEVLREKDLPGIKGKAIVPVHIDTVRQKAWLYAVSDIKNFYWSGGLYEMGIKTRKCRQITFRHGAKQFDTIGIDPGFFRSYKNGILVFADPVGLFEIKEGSLFADLVAPSFAKNLTSRMELVEERVYIKPVNELPNFTLENKNGKWEKIPHRLDSLEWFFMLYNNKDQTYWASFKYKLVHYDKNFTEIKTYIEKDGYDGHAFGMILDNAGNLWFVNVINQVGRLNIASGIITMLSEANGYHEKDFDGGTLMAKDARGNLYFGTGFEKGSDGLGRIYPEKFSSIATSSVYFRSLTINQKTLPLSVGVNNLEELSLGYNQNTISIETGIIDYYAKGQGHIRYKLKSGDNEEDWQYGPAYYTIRYEKLPPGKYTLTLQASNIGNEFNSPEKILMIHIRPAFWQRWWFITIATLFVLGLFYTAIRYRTQQKFHLRLERSEKDKQMALLQQEKMELEMQALRAQMNPHFIFNSLNSINRFILQNNKAQASEYLTKFSKLVRLILQNSQAALIPLESELESLELYLDLEALRFDHRFGYKITVPKDLDIDVLKVPPLIIQPYAENAIWHGLMHKEEKGQLDIEVSQENDQLFFRIADDGIGRKRAAELASKSATKHKSVGLKITAERIAMLQKSNGAESPVTINDLLNPDGSAAGTEVIIRIPVLYD